MFFQSLTERIEKKSGDERKKLEDLRTKLLEITRLIDQRTEEEFKRANELLNTLLAAEDIQKATTERLEEMSDVFVQLLNSAVKEANQKNDSERMPKLQQIATVLQQASAPPPELALLEELLDAPDEASLNKLLEQHAKEITPELSSIIANILTRSEEQAGDKPKGEDAKTIDKLKQVYRAILKFTMKKSMG